MVITRVPPLLHTPLSRTPFLASRSSVRPCAGAARSSSDDSRFVAVVCATSNIVGGFLITDRMLRMFKSGHEKPAVKSGTP